MMGRFGGEGFLAAGNVADGIQRQREDILRETPVLEESEHHMGLDREVKLQVP